MADQLSFASLEFAAKKKRTKRDVFPGEMAVVVPWAKLEALTIRQRSSRQGSLVACRFPSGVELCWALDNLEQHISSIVDRLKPHLSSYPSARVYVFSPAVTRQHAGAGGG